VCDCSFLYAVFGIAAQIRCTKVLCDSNKLTTLCHHKTRGLRADAALGDNIKSGSGEVTTPVATTELCL